MNATTKTNIEKIKGYESSFRIIGTSRLMRKLGYTPCLPSDRKNFRAFIRRMKRNHDLTFTKIGEKYFLGV